MGTALVGNTLPSASDTTELVLSDITVCTTAPNPDAYASLGGAEWLSGVTSDGDGSRYRSSASPNLIHVVEEAARPAGGPGIGSWPTWLWVVLILFLIVIAIALYSYFS